LNLELPSEFQNVHSRDLVINCDEGNVLICERDGIHIAPTIEVFPDTPDVLTLEVKGKLIHQPTTRTDSAKETGRGDPYKVGEPQVEPIFADPDPEAEEEAELEQIGERITITQEMPVYETTEIHHFEAEENYSARFTFRVMDSRPLIKRNELTELRFELPDGFGKINEHHLPKILGKGAYVTEWQQIGQALTVSVKTKKSSPEEITLRVRGMCEGEHTEEFFKIDVEPETEKVKRKTLIALAILLLIAASFVSGIYISTLFPLLFQ